MLHGAAAFMRLGVLMVLVGVGALYQVGVFFVSLVTLGAFISLLEFVLDQEQDFFDPKGRITRFVVWLLGAAGVLWRPDIFELPAVSVGPYTEVLLHNVQWIWMLVFILLGVGSYYVDALLSKLQKG